MTTDLVLTAAAPLLTAIGAILWAGYIGRGIGRVRELNPRRDLRTW